MSLSTELSEPLISHASIDTHIKPIYISFIKLMSAWYVFGQSAPHSVGQYFENPIYAHTVYLQRQ